MPRPAQIRIRTLTEADAQGLWDFRLKALETEPQAFGESVEEHRRLSPEVFAERLRLRENENFVVGVFDGPKLIGMGGFYRERHLKRRHQGRIWGVFIAPEFRGRGLARALMVDLLEKVRALGGITSVLLSVVTAQESARRLYLSLGFRSFGVEPRALKINDKYVDEEHMVLTLDGFEGSRP